MDVPNRVFLVFSIDFQVRQPLTNVSTLRIKFWGHGSWCLVIFEIYVFVMFHMLILVRRDHSDSTTTNCTPQFQQSICFASFIHQLDGKLIFENLFHTLFNGFLFRNSLEAKKVAITHKQMQESSQRQPPYATTALNGLRVDSSFTAPLSGLSAAKPSTHLRFPRSPPPPQTVGRDTNATR